MQPASPRFPSIVSGFALCLCALLSSGLSRAGSIDPPFELLHGNGNFLVVGSVAEINPVGRIVFTREKVLSGKPQPPKLIDIGVPPSVLARVKSNERYVVGYSAYGRNRQLNALVANTGGPTLLVSIGLDPALFRDTPATRALLAAGSSEGGRESRRFRALLLQALNGDDPALQTLAAGEIALNADIRERIGDEDALARAARNARTSLPARTLLLEAAAAHPKQLGDWWQAAATDIVKTTPTGGYSDESTDPSTLVLGALDALDQHHSIPQADALKRWLRSANPALAERAALMLRKLSAETEQTAVKEAVADPVTPASTRNFLGEYLRRSGRPPSAPAEAGSE